MIILNSCLVDLAGAVGKDTRPGNREAVRVYAECTEEFHVLSVAVVLVYRHIRIGIATHLVASFIMAIAIPDALSFAILIPRAFYLESARVCSPKKVLSHLILLCNLTAKFFYNTKALFRA